MEIFIFMFFLTIVAFGAGYKASKYYGIDYKVRWLEALEVIKNEKVLSEELKKFPEPLPKRYQGLEFVESYGKETFGKVPSSCRKQIELARLQQGLLPRDSMGNANPDDWTEVRLAQLELGWEHWGDGWYKVK